MTAAPVRLQLSRRKGFRLQEHSRAVNGLPAVNVTRPNRWGNPFHVGPLRTREQAIEMFRAWNATGANPVEFLRGHNLACWCALGAPCHADVLLELANAEELAMTGQDAMNKSNQHSDQLKCQECLDHGMIWSGEYMGAGGLMAGMMIPCPECGEELIEYVKRLRKQQRNIIIIKRD